MCVWWYSWDVGLGYGFWGVMGLGGGGVYYFRVMGMGMGGFFRIDGVGSLDDWIIGGGGVILCVVSQMRLSIHVSTRKCPPLGSALH